MADPTSTPHGELIEQSVDAVCESFEQMWAAGERPQLQLYADRVPRDQRSELVRELIPIDVWWRRKQGEIPTPKDYFDCFPENARQADLESLLSPADSAGFDRLAGSDDDSRVQHDEQSTVVRRASARLQLDGLESGQVIDDFELLFPLGRGAFAKVFLAKQISMQRLVAVKISADFGSEPQTLARLDHENIVRVLDQRRVAERGMRLLYMNFLPGGTLKDVIDRMSEVGEVSNGAARLLTTVDESLQSRAFERPSGSRIREELMSKSWPETVAWIGAQLASALLYAHQQGVLHRDIKPANVLLTAEAIPQLADFNISFGSHVAGTTATSYFGGTLVYMSPEQLEASHPNPHREPDDLDERADIYSLGVLLWELLYGERPCSDPEGGDLAQTIDSLIASRTGWCPPPEADLAPEARAVSTVLAKSLVPDREQRWSDAGQMARQLKVCQDSRARMLIYPPTTSWIVRLRRIAVFLFAAIALIPNAVVAVANYAYNKTVLVSRVVEQVPAVAERFEQIQHRVNGIAFPIGLTIGVWLVHRVNSFVRRENTSLPDDESSSSHVRACLRLGEHLGFVCMTVWLITGIVYPSCIDLAAGQVPRGFYLHFFVSQLTCGLVATAYPVFLVTFCCVRCLYPAMVRYGVSQPEDLPELTSLERRLTLYLGLTASVPLLAMTGLLLGGAGHLIFPGWIIAVICLGGVIGFGLVFWLYREMQADLAVLKSIAR